MPAFELGLMHKACKDPNVELVSSKTSTVLGNPEPHLVLVFVLELLFNLSDDRHTGAEEDVALQMDNPRRQGWSQTRDG